ncbi:MAG: hypothetical protein R3F62_00285 [Planctomycetota bacterium]
MSDVALRERERRWRERGDLASELAYREAAARSRGHDPTWLDDQASCELLVRGPRVAERVSELAQDPWLGARRSPLPGVWALSGPSPNYLRASAERVALEPVALWPRLRLRPREGQAEVVTRVVQQTSESASFAQLRLRLTAAPGAHGVSDGSELPVEFRAVVAEALRAALGGHLLRAEVLAARPGPRERELGPGDLGWLQSGVPWTGLQAHVVSGRDHPTDSHARAFRAVTQRALILALTELGFALERPALTPDPEAWLAAGAPPAESLGWEELPPAPALAARRAAFLALAEDAPAPTPEEGA